MLSHSPTFLRGVAYLLAWLSWVAGGYLYAHFNGPFPETFRAMTGGQKLAFGMWLSVGMGLLYLAATRLVGEASSWSRGDRG